jgi:hypothetical protein
MIYKSNLEELILNRHKNNSADELMILSGYTGPSPITKLADLPIKTSVIHGIKVQVSQKNVLASYQNITETTGVDVFIKDKYNHSKIYCWLKNKEPIDILSGSANFSTAGLNSSLDGESLFDIEKNAYEKTYDYLKDASNDSIICTEYIAPDSPTKSSSQSKKIQLDSVLSFNPPKAEIFVGGEGGKMQLKSGWNWGHGKGNNAPGVAEQRLRVDLVRAIPSLFPNNGININHQVGQALKNKKPNAEILFDDGFIMDASFEQESKSGGQVFYKAFCSYPDKATYGEYVRKRLGLDPDALVTDYDIANWANSRGGRKTISLELIEDGVYFCDFS